MRAVVTRIRMPALDAKLDTPSGLWISPAASCAALNSCVESIAAGIFFQRTDVDFAVKERERPKYWFVARQFAETRPRSLSWPSSPCVQIPDSDAEGFGRGRRPTVDGADTSRGSMASTVSLGLMLLIVAIMKERLTASGFCPFTLASAKARRQNY
jgi:hypothetical protein